MGKAGMIQMKTGPGQPGLVISAGRSGRPRREMHLMQGQEPADPGERGEDPEHERKGVGGHGDLSLSAPR